MSKPAFTSAVHDAFRQRCEQLQIPVWLCDPQGNVVSGADVLAHDEVSKLVSQAASRSEPIAVLDGRHLLAIEDKKGAQVLSISVALLPQSESTDQLARMLRWSHDDIARNHRTTHTLGQFSEQLAQSYEENQMLLGLSRALNREASPAQIIQSICDGLMEIMPFGWIAIGFANNDKQVPELSGEMIMAGDPPCEPTALWREFAAILGGNITTLPRLHPRGSSAITNLVDSEVVAEPILHDDQTIALLLAGNKGGDDPDVSSFETQFISGAAGFLSILHENIARFAEQQSLFLGTLKALTASIDAKDHYTRGHSERVAHLAWLMAKTMKLDATTVEEYRIAGIVHDVGKIGVPEAILCKPGRPTDEEFAKIRRHPEIGHEILRDIPKLHKSLPAVLHHHERWDGRGYPHGLAGEKIPLIARVMAMADAFDAMSSTRSYRAALTRDKVLSEMLRCSGAQFDPELVPTFVRMDLRGFDALVEKHRAGERSAA
jgi:HD-GYP domain-containing protein (c-di-GMP phosphodiesterase class II)